MNLREPALLLNERSERSRDPRVPSEGIKNAQARLGIVTRPMRILQSHPQPGRNFSKCLRSLFALNFSCPDERIDPFDLAAQRGGWPFALLSRETGPGEFVR